MKKRMKEERDREGRLPADNPKSHFSDFSNLNQAVPNHLADESQTRRAGYTTGLQDGQVVYTADAYDSRLRGD